MVAANSTLANETVQLSRVQCGRVEMDFEVFNMTVSEGINDLMQPISSWDLLTFAIGPAVLVLAVALASILHGTCQLCGFTGSLIPPSIAMLCCPMWMTGHEVKQPLHGVVFADLPGVRHTLHGMFTQQFPLKTRLDRFISDGCLSV